MMCRVKRNGNTLGPDTPIRCAAEDQTRVLSQELWNEHANY